MKAVNSTLATASDVNDPKAIDAASSAAIRKLNSPEIMDGTSTLGVFGERSQTAALIQLLIRTKVQAAAFALTEMTEGRPGITI